MQLTPKIVSRHAGTESPGCVRFFAWHPEVTTGGILEGAWTVQQRYGRNWRNVLIASAARATQCRYLLTNELQRRQKLNGSGYEHFLPLA